MTPPSLRHLLLRWLAPATALLLLASAVTGYFTAVGSATLAYDRALLDGALALSQQIRNEQGRLVLNLQPQASQVLTTDKYDRIFFAVRGPDDTLLGGTAALTEPETALPVREPGEHWSFADHRLNGQPIRVAALQTQHDGLPVSVLMAETTVKRSRLVREVLIGMLLPELLLVAATLAIVVIGVRHGLRPLEGLRGQLSRRSEVDLRPIDVDALPEEIQPLAGEINNLLARLGTSIDAQRHFVSDAAHQLRTPIAALQAQVEALQQEGSAEQARQLAPILAGVRRQAHLVHQLLALARAEPDISRSRQTINLDVLIRDGADRWLPDAIARGVDLGFELAPATVSGVALLLEELVANLVDNALRYTPAGGTVNVRCGMKAGAAIVEVDDSGPGIPEKDRKRVFERFVRLEGAGSEGCGVGLAIVQMIARQHDATVAISDSPLGGTRVRVSFPRGTG